MSETIIDLEKKNMGKKISRYIIAAIIAILAIVVLANSFCTIQAGHTGVVTTFGKVSEKVLEEGLHFKIPFIQQVIQIDNRVLKTDVESSSASKDLQMVSSTISVNYRVARNQSASIYQNVGVYFDDVIVKPAIQECVKSVTAQYT
ncbi:MAG: prohibitin family protein, partial [Oscillospiraceae bacterium]|nr:prohibitin family protein [Oscillospiraceae bacterium]